MCSVAVHDLPLGVGQGLGEVRPRSDEAQDEGGHAGDFKVCPVPPDDLDALLAEQTAYYRARAGEYDETSAFDAAARADLVAALEDFAPRGHVLELACGTGQWTGELAKHADQVTAVDAAPEMLSSTRKGSPPRMSPTCKPTCSAGRPRTATTSSSSPPGCRTSRRSFSTASGR